MTIAASDINTWKAQATRELLDARNGDGGWAYYVGQASSIEPTALAVLALLENGEAASARESAIGYLADRQRSSGFFAVSSTHDSDSWLTPLAGLAMHELGQSDVSDRAAGALLSESVFTFINAYRHVYDYDTSIPGWAYTVGDFSFIEPTALAMVFLKRTGRSHEDRVRRGVDLMRDRALRDGGWNYGEPNVLQSDLYPVIVPTALVLLALADEQDDQTDAGIQWLTEEVSSISSLMSLGWAAIALNVLGRLDEEMRGVVVQRWSELPIERRTSLGTALCLLGLSDRNEHLMAVI